MSKLVIIIPDAIGVAESYKDLREQIANNYAVSAISLPQKTFIATTCKSSVLYLSSSKNQFLSYCDDYKELDWQKVDYSILAKNNWVFRGEKQLGGETTLRDFLEQIHPLKAQIEPNQKYYELTVRTNGRGVERRIRNKQDYILGSEIQSDRYVASANLLIFSKIDARNGSMGIIPENLGNSLITSTFLLFRVKNINPYYLVSLLTNDYYQSYFESLSCGTTNRRTLGIEDFLNTKIKIDKNYSEIVEKIEKKQELERQLRGIDQELKDCFKII